MTTHAPEVVAVTPGQRRRAILASTIGTTLEFYDFVLFASLSAIIFPQVFYSGVSPALGTLLSFATLGIGYLARPVGGIIFGHFGDRLGRRRMLMITVVGIGVVSVLIGCLPSSQAIGPSAAVILVVLRVLQGLAVGGEWGGAALLAMENSPVKRRGFAASAALAGGPLGAVLATALLGAFALMPNAQFASFGWRIPFYISAVFVVVGVLLRHGIPETKDFVAAAKAGQTKRVLPIAEVFTKNWRILILTVLVGIVPLFVNSVTQSVGIGAAVGAGNSRTAVLWSFSLVSILQVFTIAGSAALSDRFGRIRVLIVGIIAAGVLLTPSFLLLQQKSIVLVFVGFAVMCCFAQSISYGPFGAYANEYYDTAIRYTGGSLSYQLAGGISGAIAPVLGGTLLIVGHGSPVLLGLVFGGICLIALAAAVLSRRTPLADRARIVEVLDLESAPAGIVPAQSGTIA